MGNYTILWMFENPRRGRQTRNLTTNVPKILDLKSSSEHIFSENCRWVPLRSVFIFLLLNIPDFWSCFHSEEGRSKFSRIILIFLLCEQQMAFKKLLNFLFGLNAYSYSYLMKIFINQQFFILYLHLPTSIVVYIIFALYFLLSNIDFIMFDISRIFQHFHCQFIQLFYHVQNK